MLRAPRPLLRLMLAALVAGGLACGDDDLDGLSPRLVVEDANADASGTAEWLLDFGEVGVGTSSRRALTIANLGKSSLTLVPVALEAPFSLYVAGSEVQVNQRVLLDFEFAPTDEGAASRLVTVTSDGGTTTVRLTGKGVKSAPCQLSVQPPGLDFAAVTLGQQKELTVTLRNVGASRCALAVKLAAATNAAYTLVAAPAGQFELAAEGEQVLTARFKPTVAGGPQLGGLDLEVEGADPQRVPFTGTGAEACPGALPDGSCPVARETVYVNDSTTLYTYDAETGRTTRKGTFRAGSQNLAGITDIAIDQGGSLLGVRESGGTYELYRLNPDTAGGARIATLTVASNGLTFLPDGRLVSAGTSVVVLDRTTGRVVDTLVPAGRYATSGDIIALPDGYLYWSVLSAGADRLVRIDPDAKTTRDMGSTGVNGIYGLGYADGVLYGFTSGGRSVVLDPNTGRSSGSRPVAGDWWGATTNPARWAD